MIDNPPADVPQAGGREATDTPPPVPPSPPTSNRKRWSPTDEQRQKMSAAAKGRTRSPELRAQISKAMTGRKHSAEAKARMSEAAKKRGMGALAKRWEDPAWMAEHKLKSGARFKALWQDPEFRARRIEQAIALNKKRAGREGR